MWQRQSQGLVVIYVLWVGNGKDIYCVRRVGRDNGHNIPRDCVGVLPPIPRATPNVRSLVTPGSLLFIPLALLCLRSAAEPKVRHITHFQKCLAHERRRPAVALAVRWYASGHATSSLARGAGRRWFSSSSVLDARPSSARAGARVLWYSVLAACAVCVVRVSSFRSDVLAIEMQRLHRIVELAAESGHV
jgi:hypothetical protein